MDYQQGKATKKRKASSYLYSVFSIALVLFVLGILAVFVFQAKFITTNLKENIVVHIELNDGLNEVDIVQLTKQLESRHFTKEVNYVSKDQAAARLKDELGEDFIDMLGYNPLYASMDMNLAADYSNTDSLQWIKEDLMAMAQIKHVSYPEFLVNTVNENVRKFTLLVIVIGILLLLVAVSLIDNTIRLAMFSNRFLIRSMQLVGATRWFIVRPFIWKGISNGFVSGILGAIALVGLLYMLEQKIPGLLVLKDLLNFAIIIAAIVAGGVIMTAISTHFAVRKYLSMQLDDLY